MVASSGTSEQVLDILTHVNLSQGIIPDEGAFNSLAVMDSVVKNAVENERRLLLEALTSTLWPHRAWSVSSC
jgi:hypothetical protein